MPTIISKIIIYLALIGLGWVIGQYLENIAYFTYSYEISLIDVFSLIVTALMAWYVSRILEKIFRTREWKRI